MQHDNGQNRNINNEITSDSSSVRENKCYIDLHTKIKELEYYVEDLQVKDPTNHLRNPKKQSDK